MSDTSPALGLPFIMASQAQKHVTHNEALRVLDAIVHLTVDGPPLPTPPLEAETGQRFLVGDGADQDWAGHDGDIAVRDGNAWFFVTPQPGWRANMASTGQVLRFADGAWTVQAPDLQNLPAIGVGTTADDVNRLSVVSDASLLTHDGAGHQVKVNKASEGDTASVLFQTGWSGRAEMGTTGNDDFAIKVSADGSAWSTALSVEAESGRVIFPKGSQNFRERLTGYRAYYVRPDGSDANLGLSDDPAGAFATIQRAVSAMLSLDCGIYDADIIVRPDVYAGRVDVDGPVLGSGTYRIMGDPSAPETVQVDGFRISNGSTITIEGFETTAGNGIQAVSDAKVFLRDMKFSGPGTAISNRQAYVDTNYATLTIGSAVTSIATMYNYAYNSMYQTNFVLEDNIDWGASGAFYCQSFCLVWLQGATFSQAAVPPVGRRYNASVNSVINTGAAETFIPGSNAGSLSTGGQYV